MKITQDVRDYAAEQKEIEAGVAACPPSSASAAARSTSPQAGIIAADSDAQAMSLRIERDPPG